MSGTKLTYATMFNPPPEMHDDYVEALEHVRSTLGGRCAMLVANREHNSSSTYEVRSPIDRELVLARVAKGGPEDADLAVRAARDAFAGWNRTPWQERVAAVRRVADLIEERLYDLSVATTLNVGKSRMEAFADVQESADLLRAPCDAIEAAEGYVTRLEDEPLPGHVGRNRSVLKPYGVWLVISPFNFPAALTCGPVGAALVAGNTVVTKPSPETAWCARLVADCFRDAGLPDGVFNFVTGPNDTLGQALLDHPDIAGATFTGSYGVGMKILRTFAGGDYPRPVVLEMGGKNAAIVSRNADIDRAAWGIARSGFGFQGQKCSASSRVYVERPVYDELVERVAAIAAQLVVGDPTERDTYLGPVVRESSYRNYVEYCDELSLSGKIVTGGQTVTDGDKARGWYCQPTVVTGVPRDHRLWKHEMFVPIVMIESVDSIDEAIDLANDVRYGLTGGFFGTHEEAQTYFDRIEVGVAYVNRGQGASSGSWPGYQSFGGWKASGATGKGSGGPYYLLSYMREQSQSIIE